MSSQEVIQARLAAESSKRELEEAIRTVPSPASILENYLEDSISKLGIRLIRPAMDAFEKKPILICLGTFSVGLFIGAFLSKRLAARHSNDFFQSDDQISAVRLI